MISFSGKKGKKKKGKTLNLNEFLAKDVESGSAVGVTAVFAASSTNWADESEGLSAEGTLCPFTWAYVLKNRSDLVVSYYLRTNSNTISRLLVLAGVSVSFLIFSVLCVASPSEIQKNSILVSRGVHRVYVMNCETLQRIARANLHSDCF